MALTTVIFVSAAFGALAVDQASGNDLRRAATKVPGPTFRATDFVAMNKVLNGHLQKVQGLVTAPCDSFEASTLQQDVLTPIFRAAEPQMLALYAMSGDNRQRPFENITDQQSHWQGMNDKLSTLSELHDTYRDGLCHEAVMAFVHHLSEGAKKLLLAKITIPLLPERLHETTSSNMTHQLVLSEYQSKVSCQQCHTGPITDPKWIDATLPKPLPADPQHPGRDRQRQCDYQNDPPCGPCEGLGGPRWGDGVDEFTPVNCTVLAAASDVPAESRPRPAFPKMGQGHIAGDSRKSLAIRPDPTKPGTYGTADATVYFAWDDKMARMLYVFNHMIFGQPVSQMMLQTLDQIQSNSSVGIMLTILGQKHKVPSLCLCQQGITGEMHTDAFVPHEQFDPLDLPAEDGGLNYLGRVRLSPSDGDNRTTVIADHYMKWAFHFLVDADKNSSGYGLPVRLFAPYGTRFIYSDWKLGDPREENPDLFKIPKHCLSLKKADADACAPFRDDAHVEFV